MTMDEVRDVLRVGGESPVVLQMLLNEIGHVREAQREHRLETRQEFQHVREKIEELREEVKAELSHHSKDIAILETKAALAGRMSGFIAGALSGLVTGIIVAAVKHFIFGG